MSAVQRAAAGLAVAAMAAVGVGLAAGPAGATQELPETVGNHLPVPAAIRVPDGNKRIAVMPARGVQTYQCTNGSWAFLQPDAILTQHRRPAVLHSKGPVWTDVRDGSSVTAAVQGSSPVANAIPQLLLKATTNRGPGLLGPVTFIQRLNTVGGLSPTGACADGVTASVPYTATYTFWVPK